MKENCQNEYFLGKTDLARIKKMSDAELESNALSDEDNLPLTLEQLKEFRPFIKN